MELVSLVTHSESGCRCLQHCLCVSSDFINLEMSCLPADFYKSLNASLRKSVYVMPAGLYFIDGEIYPVFPIYRDFPGILIVLIPFWSGMG